MDTDYELRNGLKVYYFRHFPWGYYVTWLKYGRDENFQKREFTLATPRDVWQRFKFFSTYEELREYLVKQVAVRLDLGPIYDRTTRVHKSIRYNPLQQEVVIDVDANDYDNVRTCCEEAKICQLCWKYMAIACEIIEATLRNDFHCQHLLFSFSGRRGIHVRVCDEWARHSSRAIRQAIAKYLQLLDCRPQLNKRLSLPDGILQPQVKRAIDIIKPRFIEVCINDQQLLDKPEKIKDFLKMLPENYVKAEVEELFKNYNSGIERWTAFVEFIKRDNREKRKQSNLVEEIMLQFCYPRFDCPVTIQKGHLLKAPFSMHPKTEMIAIPFDPKNVYQFNLDDVPTLRVIAYPYQTEKYARQSKVFEESIAVFKKFVEKCTGIGSGGAGAGIVSTSVRQPIVEHVQNVQADVNGMKIGCLPSPLPGTQWKGLHSMPNREKFKVLSRAVEDFPGGRTVPDKVKIGSSVPSLTGSKLQQLRVSSHQARFQGVSGIIEGSHRAHVFLDKAKIDSSVPSLTSSQLQRLRAASHQVRFEGVSRIIGESHRAQAFPNKLKVASSLPPLTGSLLQQLRAASHRARIEGLSRAQVFPDKMRLRGSLPKLTRERYEKLQQIAVTAKVDKLSRNNERLQKPPGVEQKMRVNRPLRKLPQTRFIELQKISQRLKLEHKPPVVEQKMGVNRPLGKLPQTRFIELQKVSQRVKLEHASQRHEFRSSSQRSAPPRATHRPQLNRNDSSYNQTVQSLKRGQPDDSPEDSSNIKRIKLSPEEECQEDYEVYDKEPSYADLCCFF